MNHFTKLFSLICFTILCATVGLQAGQIHEAVDAGDLDKIRMLIEANPTLLESEDDHGNTPLNRGCFNDRKWSRQSEAAKFLIDKGANVNTKNNSGTTPLIGAFCGTGADFDLIQRLVVKGADINARENSGLSPFLYAAWTGDPDIAKFLIDHGADINSRANGKTALHMAITLNSTDALSKLLVESGAKLNQKALYGNTELHLAAIQGFADLTQCLIEHGADVNAVNDNNRTSFYYAAKHGYRSVADVLIAAGAGENTIVETNYGKAPQLTSALREGEAYLWYIDGGYVVKTKGHLLLFGGLRSIDESLEAGLANGHLNPNELAGQKITVFSGYPRRIMEPIKSWFSEFTKRLPQADWVLFGVPKTGNVLDLDLKSYRVVGPNENVSVEGIQVHAIAAMDQGGMGYLLEADGVKVFFGGSHVCSNKASEVKRYHQEIDSLKRFGPIDIAILRVRGHWNNAYEPYLYLIDQLSPKTVYLMGGNGGAVGPEEYPKCAKVLRVRNIKVEHPEGCMGGDRFHYTRD